MAVEVVTTKPGVEIATLTDVGRQRSNNEDSYLYWEPSSDEEFRRKGRLAVIADGMGGYEGGQEASRIAVETVRHVYESATDNDPQVMLLVGLLAAHESIQRYAEDNPKFHGMGTTCTAVSLIGPELRFAHIGDSRLYRVGSNHISRLTRDHSYVSKLVESGIVRSEDAESHPQRHILTAALGSGRDLVPDRPDQPVALDPGDTLVLCTDGLWSLVHEYEIANLARSQSPAEVCRALVKLALERGGPDNVTVLVMRIAA